MNTFLTAFDRIPDPRAENAHHELGELLVAAFVFVLRSATSCLEMSAFGRAKAHIFRDFLKLRHAIPSHDTFSTVFRMIDPKALDTSFGQVFADVEALLADGDVVAIDGKSLRGARQGAECEHPHDGVGLRVPAAPAPRQRAHRSRHRAECGAQDPGADRPHGGR